jgi:hypothetical protein
MDAHTAIEALALAEGAASVRDAAALLRARYAPLRVVVVDAFDMREETPAACGARCTLYYGSSDGHCWTVTSDAARAAGFFLTEGR